MARILKWTGIAAGALLIALLLFLWLVDWNAMRGPVSRFAGARLGRPVTIAGPLEVRWAGLTPHVTASRLSVGNAPWDSAQPMANIEKLSLQIKLLSLLKGEVVLPQLRVERAQLYLHREASGRANWQFGKGRQPARRGKRAMKLPLVRDFLLEEGQLRVVDGLRKLTFTGRISAHEQAIHRDAQPFHIEGRGELNRKPFELQVRGGPLVNLQPSEPYPFKLTLHTADIAMAADGTIAKPFDMGSLQMNLRASGKDLADLYYLSGLALPNTPRYEIKAAMQRKAELIRITGLEGMLGGSDVHGDLVVDLSGERPKIGGKLASKQLNLADMGAPLGAPPKNEQAAAPADLRLFPDARLQVNRVRGMDADIRYAAQGVRAKAIPLKQVSFHAVIDNGVLNLPSFSFELPQGRLSGTARIDARRDIPYTELDVRLADAQLEQFKGRKPDSQPALGGTMLAHARLTGAGASVHDMVSHAKGAVTAVIPRGEIRAAFAELTGINVARGLGLLMKKDEERADIRCGIAHFQVRDGVMRAENIVFDTEDVLITGGGEIRLGPEELDLSIKGQPKKLRLFRVRAPIELNGHLRKAAIGVDAGKLASQGGIAAAVSALVAPLAAVVAFVDPGLAKDANCAALFAEAQREDAGD